MALITGDNFNNFGVGNPDLLGRLTPDGNSYEWKQDTAFPVTLNTPITGKAGSVGTTGAKFPEYYIDHDLGTTDYRVKVTCFSLDNDVTNHFTGLRARRIDDNNEISAGLLGGTQGGTRGIVLLQNATNRGFFQFDWLNSTEYEIELECVDSSTPNQISCKVWLNGVLRITSTITDATIYGSNGRAGIRGIHIASTSQYWDNIEVNSLSTVFNPTGSSNLSFSSTGQVHSVFHPSGANNLSLNSFASIAGGIINPRGSTAVSFSSSGKIAGGLFSPQASANVSFSSSAIIRDVINPTGSANVGFSSTASINFDDFSFKWSIEHLEASDSHGFPSVYVQVSNQGQPAETFSSLVSTSEVFERRLLEMPRLQEVQLDDRSGLAGFQRVTLQADNSDGLLNGLDLQDSYVRIFFVDADGTDYKEFNGKVVDWTLSHTVTINVEDLDALAFTQELPKRTLNDLVEAEKLVDADFAITDPDNKVVVADDLGKPIPIIFGRAVKVPLLYVKADDSLVGQESAREYDYIIGEGVGLGGNNFKEVFTVYREEQALDDHSFTTDIPGPGPRLIKLPDELRRPDSWYKYWWVSALGENRYVTDYDSSTNIITFSGANVTVPNNTFVDLREWRFYDGAQTGPYAGYAFIRFKKRLGTIGRTDQLYADVNGLGGGDEMSVPDREVNRVRAVESILSNNDWGLGLAVDSGSFATAATTMLNDVGSLTCEGAIINQTSATDVFQKLLSFRDMVLLKEGDIKISVDGTKSSPNFNFGLGDETGFNNILNASPSISYKHPNEKVKDLKVRYRKNHRENDTFLHEFTRSSSLNGTDENLDLPFVYDHETADRALDYKRKRFAASDRTLSLDIGEDGKKAKRGELVTVDIPSLGVSSNWEVKSSNVTPAGSNSLNLVPYSATSYTYTSFDSEGGTLPIDPNFNPEEPFDIPPDFTNTPPEPVTGEVAMPGFEIQDDLTRIGYIDVTWTPPGDGNYLEGKVKTKVSGANDGTYIEHPHGFDRVRATPLKVGLTYDLLVSSVNINNLESYALPITGVFIPGDITDPKTPENVIGKGKFNKVSWEWDAVTENDDLTPIEDLKGYEYRVWNHPTTGTQIYPKDQTIGFTTDTRVEITDSEGDLTTNDRTLYFEVRAIDDSGNTSGYAARVPATTDDILQGDITDGEIIQVASASSPSEVELGSSANIISISITPKGSKVEIIGSFSVRNNNFSPSSGAIVNIKRGSTILRTKINVHQGLTSNETTDWDFNFVDTSPGSVSVTYSLETGASSNQLYRNRYIYVGDRKR